MTAQVLSFEERVWSKVQRRDPDHCWEWTGGHQNHGYGQVTQHGIKLYVHRLMYERFVGPIPPGLELDHLCRNPGCCNPRHLEAVTHAVNMKRSGPALKTACKYGHDWTDPRNVGTHKGKRTCAECSRVRLRRLLADPAWRAARNERRRRDRRERPELVAAFNAQRREAYRADPAFRAAAVARSRAYRQAKAGCAAAEQHEDHR